MTCLVNPYRFGSGVTSSFSGSLLYKSTGDQTIGSTPTALTWDTEIYDNGDWHSTVTNPSRATVPSGVSLVELISNAQGTASNEPLIEHRKNGSSFAGMGKADGKGGSTNYVNIVSAPIAVTAGDYLETLFSNTGTNTPGAVETVWYSIAAMDPATKYALVRKSAAQSLTASTLTILSFDTEDVDTNGFHDTVTNNSRLTVPSGVSLVRLRANGCAGNVTGLFVMLIFKGGTFAMGLPQRDCDTTAEENISIISAPLEVTAGDYFEVNVLASSATSVPSANNVWFSIEEVKMPATYQRALVGKSATQTIPASTFTLVNWDAETYDTASMHDNVTNNTRLTVPAGCTKARPTLNIVTSSTSGSMSVLFTKNSLNYIGQPRYTNDTSGVDGLNVCGAWVDVVPGDYFEAVFFSFAGCTIASDTRVWFCLECQ